MKTLSERNRILNEVKDTCYLAFFDGNPEEDGKEITVERKKITFPTATNGYLKSTNQIDITGGEERTLAYGETSQKTYTGKNLFNWSQIADSGATFGTSAGNGTLTVDEKGLHYKNPNAGDQYITVNGSGSLEPGAASVMRMYNLSPNTGYTFSYKATNWSQVFIRFFKSNGDIKSTLSSDKLAPGDCSYSFTAPEDTHGYQIRIDNEAYNYSEEYLDNDISDMQIEQGSTATSYEPYVGGIPSPNPDYPQDVVNITIGNMELCKIGDYQDYLYTENGKWYVHKEIGKKVLNGTENWGLYPAQSIAPRRFGAQDQIWYADSIPLISNYFIGSQKYSQIDLTIWMQTNYVAITDKNSKWASVLDLTTWLSSNNVIVTYPLATATDTEITDATTRAALEEMFGDATGVAKFWGVYDSAVGGKLLYYYIMPYDVNIVQGSTITINAGNCVLKEG